MSNSKNIRSIRAEICAVFVGIMLGTFMLSLLINFFFMERVYTNNREAAVCTAYESISRAIESGDIDTDEFDKNISFISERYNIEMIVLDADSQTVKAYGNNTEYLVRLLWDNVINPAGDNKSILDAQEDCTLQIEEDSSTGRKYLEKWGIVGTGHLVLVRSAMENIKDSVAISNTFMAYVAITAVIFGSALMVFVSKRITDPIKKLTNISDEMKELNFEAKYTADSVNRNEIDVLGQNMNELSEILESNIRELKNANNELKKDIEKREEIDEMRKEFISNVSHELKTPIALIQGYAEGLKEGINDDDEESRNFYCDVIMDESSKMNSMVKKLMTLNQLEFGGESANMERFDLTELLGNYIRSASVLADQKGATVRFDKYPPIFVWGDEFMVEEVLQNYYSNAINHLDGDKIIEFKITPGDKKVRVSVFNTGEPIPEDSIEYIWDKFYKVDKARTREYGGSGVGLSIVKAIMESMNGDYGVINYDNGVEFYFELETK